MKKIIFLFYIILSIMSVSAQDQTKNKLKELGAKNVITIDNPGHYLKTVYILNDEKIKGGIIVFYYNEARTDVLLTILKKESDFNIQSIELVNGSTLNTNRLAQIKTSFSKLINKNEKQIPDAISSATIHSKGLYNVFYEAIKSGISIVNNNTK